MTLKELIEFASAQAEIIFRRTGMVLPMWHAIKANGQTLILSPPDLENKDLSVALVKAAFEIENVVQYVFLSEAWELATTVERDPDIEKAACHGLEHHPDRREILMLAAENNEGEEQTAHRYILRPEHGKAKLAPLIMDDMTGRKSSGRMVGLLRKNNP